MIYSTHSAEETKAVAAQFAATLHGGEVIALIGDLGAGKTTFVQGLAQVLGATTGAKSPTFTLMNIYPTNHPTIHRLVHLDFYRVNDGTHLGLEDYKTNDTVILAEWPDNKTIGPATHTITMTAGPGPTDRTIEIV